MTLLHLQQITIRCSKDQKLTLDVLLSAPTKIGDKLDILGKMETSKLNADSVKTKIYMLWFHFVLD